jgi:O-antigen ligase
MAPRRALSYCLAALAFILPLSIAGTNAALAALSLAWLWLFAVDRRSALSSLTETARSPVFLALGAYAVWFLIASLAGLDPAASLRLWPKDVHKVWAFLAIGAALAAADAVSVRGPFAFGFGLHAAIGVLQTSREWINGVEHPRAHGFLHPVSYSEVLGLGLIGAAAYLARPGATPRRRAAAVLIAIVAVALVASQTRAVLVALAAAYAAACVLESRLRRHALAAILILGAVVAIWEVMPTGGRNIRGLFSHGVATGPQRERLILWDVALKAARDRPFTGVGPGRYRDIFTKYHPNTLTSEPSWGNAHNVYLHQLAERGVPGLLILLAALAALMHGAWRADRERRDAWSLCAATATVAFLVMNVTEVAWQTEQVATLYFFLWMLGAGPRPAREIL